jgi:hypothetical protein
MAADEQYIFKPEAKKKISILFGIGILLFVLGVIMAMNSGGHHEGGDHGSIEVTKNLVASTNPECFTG